YFRHVRNPKRRNSPPSDTVTTNTARVRDYLRPPTKVFSQKQIVKHHRPLESYIFSVELVGE
ncbi:hypothetical protein CUMW_064460, partial [Citrus unshiu]